MRVLILVMVILLLTPGCVTVLEKAVDAGGYGHMDIKIWGLAFDPASGASLGLKELQVDVAGGTPGPTLRTGTLGSVTEGTLEDYTLINLPDCVQGPGAVEGTETAPTL